MVLVVVIVFVSFIAVIVDDDVSLSEVVVTSVVVGDVASVV